jgi:hypothetical protein
VLIFMPVSGYLFSAAGNHPIVWFDLITVPVIVPQNPALASLGLHLAGQWATYGLIIVHAARLGTLWSAATACWSASCRRRIVVCESGLDRLGSNQLAKGKSAEQILCNRSRVTDAAMGRPVSIATWRG